MGCTSHIPDFYWAQRKDKLFLTIDVPNVDKNQAQIQLTDEGIVSFKGRGGELHEKADYQLHLELLHPIKAEVSNNDLAMSLGDSSRSQNII